jgi:hypothetical protein
MVETLNRDYTQRDGIIFDNEVDWQMDAVGGVKRFENLDRENLQRLVDHGFVDPNQQFNGCPSAQYFLDFMGRWPMVMAHGYAVSPRRPDYRVDVEGLEFRGPISDALRAAFVLAFRDADDLDADSKDRLFCWYD